MEKITAINRVNSTDFYKMDLALLEISTRENIDLDRLKIYIGRSSWYVLDTVEKINGKPKIYFKKSY